MNDEIMIPSVVCLLVGTTRGGLDVSVTFATNVNAHG